MSLVDANIILRYLLDDHETLSAQAANIIEQNVVSLPMEVACEVVYVLQKVYKVARPEIRQNLQALLDEQLIQMQEPVVFLKALEAFTTTRLDFVDTLLWAYCHVNQQRIFTFDEKLKKYIRENS
ncbi:PIN domain-containing protein [Magnetovirga frankeli]|uniref:PIN domain-containing protein n=1 Tax=Magnetovirga frankeli TaxID=947516 RepID=UPI001293B042|nr:PIN domain-containing protein [gamma proteobacterium SS-5]